MEESLRERLARRGRNRVQHTGDDVRISDSGKLYLTRGDMLRRWIHAVLEQRRRGKSAVH